MAAETLTKQKAHHKFIEDIQMCAEWSNMLYDEFIAYCIRKEIERIKTERENKYKN